MASCPWLVDVGAAVFGVAWTASKSLWILSLALASTVSVLLL